MRWAAPQIFLFIHKIRPLQYITPMIDHIEIPVSDLKLSLNFYEKAFLPLGFKVSFGEEGKFC